MRSKEEIEVMYKTLLDIRDHNLEVDEPKQYEGFRQALWWVLNED